MDTPSKEIIEILKLLKTQNLKIDRQYKLLNKLMKIINYKTVVDENILSEIKAEIRKFAIITNPEIMNLNRQNTILVSSEAQPVYTLSNSIQYVERVSELGSFYSIDSAAQSVAANGFIVLQLTNPANSGRTFFINSVSGGSSTNSTIDILKNATFSATGTALTPANRNWSYADSSIATAKYISQATDPTTGGTLINTLIQTGGLVARDYWGSLIIPSGTANRQFYIRVVNNTNQVNILSINVSWWEFTVLSPTI